MEQISLETIINHFEKHGWDINQVPDRDDKPYLISNWNNVPQAMQDYLENYYQLGWDDTSTSCSDCGNYVYTYPSDYPTYFYTEGECVCHECFDSNPEAYLDNFIHYAGDGTVGVKAVYSWMKKAFVKAGFVPFNSESSLCKDEYQTGWHPGQHDSPEKASKLVHQELGPVEMIFFIDSMNMFEVRWSVYVRIEVAE